MYLFVLFLPEKMFCTYTRIIPISEHVLLKKKKNITFLVSKIKTFPAPWKKYT